VLDLPDGVTACLFDLDGVLTQTAKVHARAWKEMFDEYLRGRSERSGDALAGVEAGRAASFGWVVGVDRTGHAQALREHGADVVVEDLAELLHRPQSRS
jgi:beta-phosphoglucomutase-like phosphatase (HAD superfamily)